MIHFEAPQLGYFTCIVVSVHSMHACQLEIMSKDTTQHSPPCAHFSSLSFR